MKEIYFNSSDKEQIFLRVWDEVDVPKAIVQIFHGMVEHSMRYDGFAKYLNTKGYIVVADDHRGHGNTASKYGLGYIGDNGFDRIVKDEKEISEYIKDTYRDLPIYIFGHSFGSFIAQEYFIRYSNEINGIVFSGSAKQDGIDISAGRVVANIQNKLLDNKKKAKFIDKLAFGGYNKNVENPNTKSDWLSRDAKEVELYCNDEFCSFVPSINFYHSLFNGLANLYKPHRLEKIDKEKPVLVLSGDRDPVGKNGKLVKKLYEQYKDLNIKNVELKLYKDGRHEMLNEINKDEVYEDIFKWLDKHLVK